MTADDNDTILVTFQDVPEAQTFGDDQEEALARAADALETVIDAYIRDRRDIPASSKVTGASVTLPSLIATKVQIYNAMRTQRIGKAELAKRLGAHLPQVDRLLDIKHGSKLDQLEAAAHALGAELEITLVRKMGRPSTKRAVRAIVHPGLLMAQKKSATSRRSSSAGGMKKK
ncbi:MAG: type II toxin-antitoxin system HicB family antitoxin [Vicinamibacterales bacterium]